MKISVELNGVTEIIKHQFASHQNRIHIVAENIAKDYYRKYNDFQKNCVVFFLFYFIMMTIDILRMIVITIKFW